MKKINKDLYQSYKIINFFKFRFNIALTYFLFFIWGITYVILIPSTNIVPISDYLNPFELILIFVAKFIFFFSLIVFFSRDNFFSGSIEIDNNEKTIKIKDENFSKEIKFSDLSKIGINELRLTINLREERFRILEFETTTKNSFFRFVVEPENNNTPIRMQVDFNQ